MKLLTYRAAGKVSYGALLPGGIVDLGARFGVRFPTLRDAIAAGALGELAAAQRGAAPDLALADAQLMLPIPNPEKIICVGVNYANRNEEYKDGTERPKYPSLFYRAPRSFAAHGETLWRPAESQQLDYEGEIAIVIGKPGRRIPREAAVSHIAGFTCLNEGTIRDWLRHGKFNVTQGKNFERTGAIGPWMATPDEMGPLDRLRVTTRVNGEVRQDDTVENIIFGFDYLLNYISTFTTLVPGDVIATGTPVGAGARFDPPRWLKPGDTVEVEVPGVGVLSNTVEDEPR
ncbi:MAG: fumarylacetoacetate hydrolase family protein [Rhodospirillaceae bacterium]|nr:fumarylacetoacetate hydrolase family protein [Rhodospirillaceae bacterium]